MIEMLALAAVVVFLVGIGLAILTTEVLRRAGTKPASDPQVKRRRRPAAVGHAAARGVPDGLSAAAAADLAIHNSYRSSPSTDIRQPVKARV